MGKEIEYKFAATPALLERVRDAFGGVWDEIAMETAYFDTPDYALARQHITLRVRRENGVGVCTAKAPAEVGRGEWSCASDTVAPDALIALGAPEAIACLASPELKQVCGARFTRLAQTVEAEGCAVELALDCGVLLGGGKEAPLCEIEAELKRGDAAALDAFAQALRERFGLHVEKKSKFRRALALARGCEHA